MPKIIWKILGIASIFLVFKMELRGQSINLGTPPVLNFSKKTHTGGTQTWDISQDERGVIWFANNSGVLEFDGAHWRRHTMPNGTIVRSIEADGKGRLYVGAQDEFGYFASDERGLAVYHSLTSKLQAAFQAFGDIWHISVRPEGVFFRSDRQLFWYANGAVKALLPQGTSLRYLGEWKGKLLIQDEKLRFHYFEQGTLRPLEHPSTFPYGQISAMFALNPDTVLITTIKDGIFFYAQGQFQPWKTPDDAFLKENRVYCAAKLQNGQIALGTSLNGLIILDKQRRVLHHLNKDSGLQNNTVLSLLPNHKGQVWLGLDNGIDFVDTNSPFSTFYPDGSLQGTGYTVEIFKNKIYFGTNTGLYATSWQRYYARDKHLAFKMVKQSEGQVWSLSKVGDALLMGHHEGAFQIDDLTARKITDLHGVWRFIPSASDRAIAGHYNGLAAFERKGADWVLRASIPGLSESSRILAQDKAGYIWMAHPYRGIFRIRVDTSNITLSYEYFGKQHGLPSNLGNHLFMLGDQIVFTGIHGIYDFNPQTLRFSPNTQFGAFFEENTKFRYLKQDATGNIWYATDKETGFLLVENNTFEKRVTRIPIPELKNQLTDGFPFLLPIDQENVFLATGQGFMHFNPHKFLARDRVMRLVLNEVRLLGSTDSLLYGGFTPIQRILPIELKPNQNTLKFSFGAPDYPASEYVRYAHYLEGLEHGWSDWSTTNTYTFNHLRPGRYVFHVKALSPRGVESIGYDFPFVILPPWYASTLAYILYGIIFIGVLIAIIHRQKQKFELEKQDIKHLHALREAQHELYARKSAEEINRLQHEKLEAELRHQSQELASATMHLVQKSELLHALQGELEKLQTKTSNTPELGKELMRMVKILDHNTSVDADWEYFAQNFDQVHSNFLKRLGAVFPHLSRNDFKLCAYLRMNLSSKEIASLMNISLRGVEASRYRLRKRLDLHTETNLTEFLMRF